MFLPGQKKERIDLFLSGHIENATRSKVQKLIEANLVKVNGSFIKPSYKVLPNDIIEAVIPISPSPEETEPEDIPLNIVYEDEYLIIVNKPAGMVAHPAYSNYTGTLVNALLHHTKKLSELNEPGRPELFIGLIKIQAGYLLLQKMNGLMLNLLSNFQNIQSKENTGQLFGESSKKEKARSILSLQEVKRIEKNLQQV